MLAQGRTADFCRLSSSTVSCQTKPEDTLNRRHRQVFALRIPYKDCYDHIRNTGCNACVMRKKALSKREEPTHRRLVAQKPFMESRRLFRAVWPCCGVTKLEAKDDYYDKHVILKRHQTRSISRCNMVHFACNERDCWQLIKYLWSATRQLIRRRGRRVFRNENKDEKILHGKNNGRNLELVKPHSVCVPIGFTMCRDTHRRQTRKRHYNGYADTNKQTCNTYLFCVGNFMSFKRKMSFDSKIHRIYEAFKSSERR